jgi:hypothetical protein
LLSGREGKQKEHPKSRLKMARGSIRRALGSVWNAPKTDSMIKKLEKTKGRMMTATLFCLWSKLLIELKFASTTDRL